MSTSERVIHRDIIPSQTDGGVGALWDHFDDFSQIPRATGQEQGMIKHTTEWAEKQGYEFEVDALGNMLVIIPASPGYVNAPGVILQAHNDMVCVGDPNPATAGVSPQLSEDKQTLTAAGTSAGFDNGIGLAASMALSRDSRLQHGPLALMITVSEEVGLKGALGMDFQTPLDNYRFLINLDSEEEGEATISCAGGGDAQITLPIERESSHGTSYALSIENLLGGHSGVEIHKGRLNGIKVLTKAITALSEQLPLFGVADINAGTARNAIPSDARASVSLNHEDLELAQQIISQVRTEVLGTSSIKEERGLAINITPTDTIQNSVMTRESLSTLTRLLNELPHGVIAMSQDVSGLVETSNNLAAVHIRDGQAVIETMTRSSVDHDLASVRNQIKTLAERSGATVTMDDPYPGWPAEVNSPINSIAAEEWQRLTGRELEIVAIHAGLECGAIKGKYPHLEAISIGPTITGAHSTKESVDIESVETFYKFARNILASIAATE